MRTEYEDLLSHLKFARTGKGSGTIELYSKNSPTINGYYSKKLKKCYSCDHVVKLEVKKVDNKHLG